jgi:hypothetical protein
MEDAGEMRVGVFNHTIVVHQEPGKPTTKSITQTDNVVFKLQRLTEKRQAPDPDRG